MMNFIEISVVERFRLQPAGGGVRLQFRCADQRIGTKRATSIAIEDVLDRDRVSARIIRVLAGIGTAR
ncbi:hypothetical protein ACVDG8_002600 [Mesorhizobium sp. ORM8.1]